jgi:hypothetical protein
MAAGNLTAAGWSHADTARCGGVPAAVGSCQHPARCAAWRPAGFEAQLLQPALIPPPVNITGLPALASATASKSAAYSASLHRRGGKARTGTPFCVSMTVKGAAGLNGRGGRILCLPADRQFHLCKGNTEQQSCLNRSLHACVPAAACGRMIPAPACRPSHHF